MSWATRVREALATGELVVTPEEYAAIKMEVGSGRPAGALTPLVDALSRGLIGTGTVAPVRLIIRWPERWVTAADVRAAAEAQHRMEVRLGLVPPGPSPAERRRMREEMYRLMLPGLLRPQDAVRLTSVTV